MVNKKGVSEIVSYVLLILVSIAISTIVFGFLMKFIPKGQTAECPSDVSLIVQDISCDKSSNILSINLSNRGLWNVSEVHIKTGLQNSKVKTAPTFVDQNGAKPDPYVFSPPLSPSQVIGMQFYLNIGDDTLEIVPAVYNKKGEKAICPSAIITQPISCT